MRSEWISWGGGEVEEKGRNETRSRSCSPSWKINLSVFAMTQCNFPFLASGLSVRREAARNEGGEKRVGRERKGRRGRSLEWEERRLCRSYVPACVHVGRVFNSGIKTPEPLEHVWSGKQQSVDNVCARRYTS